MTTPNATNDDGKSTDLSTSDTGARRVSTGRAEDVFAAVNVPNPVAEAGTISVTGYAYDDAPGQVELAIGDGVTANVVLSPDEARALADAVDGAIVEAERDIDG